MLEVYINNTQADLMADTSITLTWENPFLSADGISTPYSISWELPRTSRNLALIGHSNRVASRAMELKFKARICFAGIELIRGIITVERISSDAIEVEFNSADVLAKMARSLHELDLGTISFGYATFHQGGVPGNMGNSYWDKSVPQAAYRNYWDNQVKEENPDIVAPPLAIKDSNWENAEQATDSSVDAYTIVYQRYSRINNFSSDGYHAILQNYAKILPSVRVGYIMKQIDSNLAEYFSDYGLRRLMVQSTYHQSYQIADNYHVWSFNADTGEYFVRICDYMPKVNTGEFVCEMLKLTCSSLYVADDKLSVVNRAELLNSIEVVDWTDRFVGEPTVEFRPAEKYVVEYSDPTDDEPVPEERPIKTASSVVSMVEMEAQNSAIDKELGTFSIAGTEQIFEQRINSRLSSETNAHYDYVLLRDVKPVEAEMQESDDIATFDMSINLMPVRMVVAVDMLADSKMVPSFTNTGCTKHDYIYCPEIERPELKRPDKVTVGIYWGKAASLLASGIRYPLLSSKEPNWGAVSGVASLDLNGENGLINRFHQEFKSWVEKDKRVIKGQLLLDVLDIHNLDLKRKIHLSGRNFFISELSITITNHTIELADGEFVEA